MKVNLRKEIHQLNWSISADVEHGECFYDPKMFREFMSDLDKMKEFATLYYEENQKKLEDDKD